MNSSVTLDQIVSEILHFKTFVDLLILESILAIAATAFSEVGDAPSILGEYKSLRRSCRFHQRKNTLDFNFTIPLEVGRNKFASCSATLSFRREDASKLSHSDMERFVSELGVQAVMIHGFLCQPDKEYFPDHVWRYFRKWEQLIMAHSDKAIPRILLLEYRLTRQATALRALGIDTSFLEDYRGLRRFPQFHQRKKMLDFILTIPLEVSRNKFTPCSATLSFRREDATKLSHSDMEGFVSELGVQAVMIHEILSQRNKADVPNHVWRYFRKWEQLIMAHSDKAIPRLKKNYTPKYIYNAAAKMIAKHTHPWIVHQFRNPDDQTPEFRLLKQRVQDATRDDNSVRTTTAWVVEQCLHPDWDVTGKNYQPTKNLIRFDKEYLYCKPHFDFDLDSPFYQVDLQEIIRLALNRTKPRHNGIT